MKILDHFKSKSLFKQAILMVIIIFIVLGEIMCSWYLSIPEQKITIHYSSAEFDKILGWKMKTNYQF